MYKRICRLVATDVETGVELFNTEQHRIKFNVDISMGQGLAKAQIMVYNLAPDEQKLLTKGDLEPL